MSDEKGKDTIDTKGLLDGTYTLKAWHEVYGDSQPQQVEIKSGKPAKPIEFKFQAKPVKTETEKKELASELRFFGRK